MLAPGRIGDVGTAGRTTRAEAQQCGDCVPFESGSDQRRKVPGSCVIAETVARQAPPLSANKGARTKANKGEQRGANKGARVNIRYDNADRLTRLLQGSDVVQHAYDAAGRLVETTLPNNIKAGYAYNEASQLTGIAWMKPDSTLLGDLGYGFDAVGRLMAASGRGRGIKW